MTGIVRSRPDAIVHIGTAKTGTTTLQHALSASSERLRTAGLAYLTGEGRADARELAAASVGEHGFEDLLDERGIVSAKARLRFRDDVGQHFADQIASRGADVGTVLISSEHLHSRLIDVEMVHAFRRLISPHVAVVRVVCYLRPQIDLVGSFHSTRVANGAPADFAATCAEFLHTDSPYSNYERLLDRWASAFGDNAIDVRIFDRKSFDGDSIVADFARYLGLDDTVLQEPERDANPSIGQLGQMLLTEVNRAVTDAHVGHEEAASLRAFIETTFVGMPARLTGAPAIDAQRRFDASNDAVRQRFRPDLDRLFPDIDATATLPIAPAEIDAFHTIISQLRTAGRSSESSLPTRGSTDR